MARTVRDELLTALDDLDEDGFKRFCAKIRDWKIETGYRKIPKSKLEKTKTVDVVDLILSRYTNSYGPELTVDVLDAIEEKDVVLNLKKALEKVKGFSWRKKPEEKPPSTSEASSSSAPNPQEKHFVDKHRRKLIANCPLVAPILDGLKSEDLLTDEQYDTIRAEKTPQDKMRKLYEFIKGWSASSKQTLYEILKEVNGPLIENLEQP
ncbi:apoptosis-associated speck-like protein containing a CARD [Lithobates pipiens]